MKINKLLFGSIGIPFFGLLLFLAPVFAAYTLFGDATIVAGGNPGMAIQLQSDQIENEAAICGHPFGCGIAKFDDVNGTTFSSLTALSADFNVTDDDCGGGSPRFQIRIDNNGNDVDDAADGNIFVSFGPSPSFTACSAGWQNTGNLIGNNDAGRYDSGQVGGSAFGTYAQALAAAGAKKILGISLVVDSSWSNDATNGDTEQTVLFDNVVINNSTSDFEPTPTPTPTLTPTPIPGSANCVISGNGAFSTNKCKIQVTKKVKVTQKNRANVPNNVNIGISTGGNSANNNTSGNVSVVSGNASASVSISTVGNVNILQVNPSPTP
jgi:hypothetical protein